MDVEYRWFKNGKEFKYTLDLEGNITTKEFWDNGNIKMEIKEHDYLPNVQEMNFYDKNSHILKNISIGRVRGLISIMEFWSGSDGETKSITRFNTNNGTRNRITYGKGSNEIESIGGEPKKIAITAHNTELRWDYTIDAYLNSVAPSLFIIGHSDSIEDFKEIRYATESKDAIIKDIFYIKGKKSTIVYIGEDGRFHRDAINEFSELPSSAYEELKKLLERFIECKKHYVEKYLSNDIIQDGEIASFLKLMNFKVETLTPTEYTLDDLEL